MPPAIVLWFSGVRLTASDPHGSLVDDPQMFFDGLRVNQLQDLGQQGKHTPAALIFQAQNNDSEVVPGGIVADIPETNIQCE